MLRGMSASILTALSIFNHSQQIDNRFNWLKRNLIDFEDHMGPVFPPDWEMSERIAVEFCDLTRKSLERLMFKRKLEIDTKLLLHAIQRTSNFESLLSRRFTGITLEQVMTRKLKIIGIKYYVW